MNCPRFRLTRPVFRQVPAAVLILGLVVSTPTERAAGEENRNDFIEIRNPKKLPAKIPCERIALGQQGDYKPCITTSNVLST